MLELLLEMLLELVGEFLLELFFAAVLDLALRAIAKIFETFRFANPVLASASYVLLGALAGGLSLLVFPHPLVHPSRLHGINLLVSPIATGLAMSQVGSMLSLQGKGVTRIESFGYGFGFAFGIALTRYLFAA
jgi:predicted PurR-regulated permease PerM